MTQGPLRSPTPLISLGTKAGDQAGHDVAVTQETLEGHTLTRGIVLQRGSDGEEHLVAVLLLSPEADMIKRISTTGHLAVRLGRDLGLLATEGLTLHGVEVHNITHFDHLESGVHILVQVGGNILQHSKYISIVWF